MKQVPLGEIFEIGYGQRLDFNKMKRSTDKDGVNFVTRSSKNLGITASVAKIVGIPPLEAGLITVTLGGTYLLSAFVQPREFYSAQNIKYLRPKAHLTFNEKAFYCLCITANRFKYSSHGREANRSLESLLVPSISEIPKWVNEVSFTDSVLKDDHKLGSKKPYDVYQNKNVPLSEIFEVKNGVVTAHLKKFEHSQGNHMVAIVRPSSTQDTSVIEGVNRSEISPSHIYPRGTLYVSTNGQGSHTYSYVSTFDFVPNSDVAILIPKREMGLAEKLFYAKAISLNRRLFSYGRKPKGDKLKNLSIPLFAPPFVYGSNLFSIAANSKEI
jgi:hypothetical protein